MNRGPSIQAEITNNLAKLAWWFGNQMLKATPFVLIAGFFLSALGGVLEGFSIAFLFWMFFMGFFFLKAILYKTVAGWIDKIDRKCPPES